MLRYPSLILGIVSAVALHAAGVQENIIAASSVFPVCDVLRNIAGEHAEVMHAVPVGANPHTYEPLPSDVRRLRKIRLFIGIHPRFDGWVEQYLAKDCRVVYLRESGEGRSSRHHDPEGAEENPHVWLSVRGMMETVDALVGILSASIPGRREAIEAAGVRYKEELRAVDAEFTHLFEDLNSRSFLQWHPAWDAFAADYGLRIVGSVEHGHGDTPSVREFRSLVEKAEREGVAVIVVGLNVQSRAVESLSREIGASVLRLDTLGGPQEEERDSYIGLMRYNARRLAGALR